MNDDVVLSKSTTIARCLRRVERAYQGDPGRLADLDAQDVIVLNLQRACDAAIDLAMHVLAVKRLGVPSEAKQAFAMLMEESLLERSLASRMQKMVGFRNIAIHEYQQLNLEVLQSVVEVHAAELQKFADAVLAL